MKTATQKSIKVIGLIIIIFSSLIIFSNFMGALMYLILGMGDASLESTSASSIFDFYLELCFAMILMGVLFLFSGIFIRKNKLWARNLAIILSSFFILFIIFITYFLAKQIFFFDNNIMLFLIAFIIIFLFSLPFALLIWFLRKASVRKIFK